MIGGILLLAILVFGISILSGNRKPEQFYKFVIFLIVAPILLAVGFNHLFWLWLSLPWWMQILSFLFLPVLISTILRLLFPKAKWLEGMQAVIFSNLIYAITFPFRFLWRAGGFLLQREHRTVRLNPYRPVVGGRPPLVNERRGRVNQNNPFDW